MYKFMFPLLAILVVLTLGFFTVDFGSNLVGNAPLVPGYANSDEFFYGYQTLTAGYAGGELLATVNGAFGDVFVYKKAFYGTNSWSEFELQPSSSISQSGSWNDSWVRGSAEGSVEVDYDEYYVVAYVCRLYNQSDVLAEQDWTLGERLLINHSFSDDLAYLCGVGGFEGGELVTNLWHLDRVDCPECAPDPVNASCGTHNGSSFLSNEQSWPSGTFCASGFSSPSSPGFPAEGSSVSWECLGERGGDDVTCSASRDALVPVDGVCGSRSMILSAQTTTWPSGAFCDFGSVSSSPGFPSQGSSVSWTCEGSYGGSDVSCSAYRDYPSSVPTACADRVPPGLVIQQAECDARAFTGYGPDCTDYADVFNGEFPGSRNVQLDQFRDNYYAMKFTVPQSGHLKGGWVFETPQYGATYSDDYLSSISTCPGDFDTAAIEQEMLGDCIVASSESPFGKSFVSWAIADEGITLDRCQLERGETYYLNFFFTDATPQTPVDQMDWVCQDDTANPSACGWAMAKSSVRDACQPGSNIHCQDGYTCQNSNCVVENPLSCDNSQGQLRPTSWTQELQMNANIPSTTFSSWEELYGHPFPRGNARDIRIRTDKYTAVPFNSGTQGSSGQVSFSDLGGNIFGVGTRPAMVSISECPGDFREQTGEQQRCSLTGIGGANPSFLWTRDSSEANVRCLIEPNTDYYLNIAYVSSASEDDLPKDLDWECRPEFGFTSCGHRIQVLYSE